MKKEFITFQEPHDIRIENEPSSFNGFVRVEKYKVTIEKLDEPKQVICERLEKLWIEEKNYHHWTPLENKAKELGYTFKGKFGEKRK
jgi:hypothetical protein